MRDIKIPMPTLYLCDPTKNTECNKCSCFFKNDKGACKFTTDINKAAILDCNVITAEQYKLLCEKTKLRIKMQEVKVNESM